VVNTELRTEEKRNINPISKPVQTQTNNNPVPIKQDNKAPVIDLLEGLVIKEQENKKATPTPIPQAQILQTQPQAQSPKIQTQSQLEKDLLSNFPTQPMYNIMGGPMASPYVQYPPVYYPMYNPTPLFLTVPETKKDPFGFIQEDATASSFNFIKDEINKQTINKST